MNSHNPPREGKVATNLAADVIALMHDLLSWQTEIERALRPMDGAYSFDDVVASVLRQERQFYQFDGCCFIMQVDTFPHYKAYHCFIACGDMQAMFDNEHHMHEVAKNLGCKKFSITGRRGWERALKERGWTHVLSVMHKDI